MDAIVIDSEFERLCPPLSAVEFATLRANIESDGCRDPLILWGDILVDGHNRYRICTELGRPFGVVRKEFATREDARNWILTNQLGRRNLGSIAASYLRGMYYRSIRIPSTEGKQDRFGGRNKTLPEGVRSTQEIAAKMFGVSASAIRNDSMTCDAIDKLHPDVKDAILAPEFLARKQHVWDLACLSHENQLRVIERCSGSVELGSLISSVRQQKTERGGGMGVSCATCGTRLAKGVTVCLKCNLSDDEIRKRLEGESSPGNQQNGNCRDRRWPISQDPLGQDGRSKASTIIGRCPECGAKLVGTQRCLACDLANKTVRDEMQRDEEGYAERLAVSRQEEPETADDTGWQDRLNELRAAKKSGDELGFHVDWLLAYVSQYNDAAEFNEYNCERLNGLYDALGRFLGVCSL